jgi:hypothetical protein
MIMLGLMNAVITNLNYLIHPDFTICYGEGGPTIQLSIADL